MYMQNDSTSTSNNFYHFVSRVDYNVYWVLSTIDIVYCDYFSV